MWLHIAFYGIAPEVGTSANMKAVAAGFLQYQNRYVKITEDEESDFVFSEELVFTDCTNNRHAEEIIGKSDLLVYNLLIPYQELETVYFRHSMVQKNIIFLIGKYYQDKFYDKTKLARTYRIAEERICTIPYSPRFQKAYENETILQYVREQQGKQTSLEAVEFTACLQQMIQAVCTCTGRKGEIYYG
jgi:hypothetical protein